MTVQEKEKLARLTFIREELFELVKEHNFVSVVDDRGCFIGIILRRDVMNYLIEKFGKTEKN